MVVGCVVGDQIPSATAALRLLSLHVRSTEGRNCLIGTPPTCAIRCPRRVSCSSTDIGPLGDDTRLGPLDIRSARTKPLFGLVLRHVFFKIALRHAPYKHPRLHVRFWAEKARDSENEYVLTFCEMRHSDEDERVKVVKVYVQRASQEGRESFKDQS